MRLPKITVQPQTLPELLNEMQAGRLQVPRFQREFVWPLAKTRALLDSLYKEFPIGTFFLWRAPLSSPPLSRPLDELELPPPPVGMPITYILDGQQRLTSLYVVIQGRMVDSRDYSKVCLDLEVATRYDQNGDEGFDEDIFVYEQGDGKRYIPVCELVGPNHLAVYNGVADVWKSAFGRAHNLIKTYPFSVVWVQEQSLGDAIVIFQRINQAGQRLSRYDLVCANVWREDFDFRQKVEYLNRKFDQHGFGALDETIFTQTFALILKDQCTTLAELTLDADSIMQSWDRIIRALSLAVDFAIGNLGVKRVEFLPYRGLLVVLAYFFYHFPGALSAQGRRILWDWFWRVTLSERYSSTSPSKMAEDARKLRQAGAGEAVTFNYPSTITAEGILRTKMTSSTSSVRNAVLCMLALKPPLNLKDGSEVELTDDFFSNVKKAERHHIFPAGYLKKRHIPATRVHLVPNFCFIPADLNKEIGSHAPSDYLARYKRENPDFPAAAKSHLLPVQAGAPLWSDDFELFLEQRAGLIAKELNGLVASGPTGPAHGGLEELNPVDVLEVRFRDFIDHRLSAVVGINYWKRTMPGDVITKVREQIAEWRARHPWEDDPRRGRDRLDFCDVGHYESIILKNWDQFSDIFQKKEEVQQHMAAYRRLRNPVQHNRPPSEIEQRNGEAAILWFNHVLDRYDRDVARLAEESQDDNEGEGAIEGEAPET